MRFIGDVHGKFEEYRKIAEASPDGISIQVGDFGIGFPDSDYTAIQNMNPDQFHYYIRGNHDNPEICKTLKTNISPMYIPDGKIHNFNFKKVDYKILFIGGALSIDQHRRTEGVDWWRDEELSMSEFDAIITKVEEYGKPFDMIVSHECPENVVSYVEPKYFYNNQYSSFTRRALQHILEINKPKMWFHGHWHTQKSFVHEGTQFHSLGELGFIDI